MVTRLAKSMVFLAYFLLLYTKNAIFLSKTTFWLNARIKQGGKLRRREAGSNAADGNPRRTKYASSSA